MGLPLTRDLTFIPGVSPIPAATMNEIQDAVVGDCTGTVSKNCLVLDGVGNVSQTARATDGPLMMAKDSAGNVRAIHDHLGYRRGRVRELYESWQWLPTSVALTGGPTQAAGTAWTYSIAAGAGLIGYLGTALDGPGLVLQSGTPNGSISRVNLTFAPIVYRTYSSIVLEWDMFLVNVGANHTDLQIGLNTSALVGTPSTAQLAATFLKRSADTNWQGYTANGTANTIQDLGVAPVAGVAQRFLLELHGSASSYGALARFFINDALVGEIPTTLPAANTQFRIYLLDEGNGAASSANTTVGPLRTLWNPQLSLPPL